MPLAFYSNPERARLVVSSSKEANEILTYYEGRAPAYIGLGTWSLRARPIGAGVFEITCKRDD